MKTYEDLTGAAGRAIFYRAERFRARDLFARHAPRVVIDGRPYHLENLSMSGLAASGERSNRASFQAGTDVPVQLEGDSGALFSGVGNLCRVEDRALKTLVALSFKGMSVDIAGIVNRHNETLMQRELNGGLSHTLEDVPVEYRRFCADVLHLLRAYRSTLSRFENISHHDGAAPDPGRIDSIYHAVEKRLLSEWHKLWLEGNEITLPIMSSPKLLCATKAFTERVLTPEFLGVPNWDRAYYKPFGYPGDFQLMNSVYEWKPRGATVYERLLYRLGLDVLECVAARMVMMQHSIAEVVAAGAGCGEPARMLSLGCGPAQEVVNYLALGNLPRPIDVTLVDQDHNALDYAYRQVFPELVRLNNGSNVRCLEVSFVELIKASGAVIGLPLQNLIYSVGLVDYLSETRAMQLACALYDKLLPGGQLVIGNAAEVPLGGRWPSEFICDWSMVFRTESDMAKIARAVKAAKWEIKSDPTGRIHMLYITKPTGDA